MVCNFFFFFEESISYHWNIWWKGSRTMQTFDEAWKNVTYVERRFPQKMRYVRFFFCFMWKFSVGQLNIVGILNISLFKRWEKITVVQFSKWFTVKNDQDWINHFLMMGKWCGAKSLFFWKCFGHFFFDSSLNWF